MPCFYKQKDAEREKVFFIFLFGKKIEIYNIILELKYNWNIKESRTPLDKEPMIQRDEVIYLSSHSKLLQI